MEGMFQLSETTKTSVTQPYSVLKVSAHFIMLTV